ncbi:MAG: hypothetical protein GXO03_00170 [Aquificae bacterium]|nr:hypothetical protein [Aquificota bacterium]
MPDWGKFRISFGGWRLLTLSDHTLEESQTVEDYYAEAEVWEPLDGKPVERGKKVAFVDGVRRTEHAVYIEDPKEAAVVEGAFVSIGAGALVLVFGEPTPLEEALKEALVERYLLLRDRLVISEPVVRFVTRAGVLEFKVLKTDGELSPKVNELMGKLELKAARGVIKEGAVLIITDGPLRVPAGSLPLVGYVKKQNRLYLPPEGMEVLRALKKGQRTPVMLTKAVRDGRTLECFTWYVKVGDGEGITGVARVEADASLGLERVKELADLTAFLLPVYASEEFNDERAPQNLVPVKYLEAFLRRHLGSQALIRRLVAEVMLRRAPRRGLA